MLAENITNEAHFSLVSQKNNEIVQNVRVQLVCRFEIIFNFQFSNTLKTFSYVIFKNAFSKMRKILQLKTQNVRFECFY